jgi:hypothetical protein
VAAEDILTSHADTDRGSHRTRNVICSIGILAVMAAGVAFFARPSPPADSAGAFLTCNPSLPKRALSVNVSWSDDADVVTLDFGDGQVVSLAPDIADNQRLSDMIAHQYAAPGRFEVKLSTRRGSAVSEAQCTFVAAE